MKQTVEEWRTVEGYPDYEVSNMGRCRNRRTGNEIHLNKNKTKIHGKYYYTFRFRSCKEGYSVKKSCGKTVAEAFVPNPEGYTSLNYRDGDRSNCVYTNLEWIRCNIWVTRLDRIGASLVRKPKKRSKEECIMLIDRALEMLAAQKKAIEEGRTGEFVLNFILPVIKSKYLSIKSNRITLLDEYLSLATEAAMVALAEGQPIFSISSFFHRTYSEFISCYKKQVRKERLMKKQVEYRDELKQEDFEY